MKKSNIVVLGGGTAGWLTALHLKKILPAKNITLIQSKEIGIIGVGEATTPHLVSFLRNLNIRPIDVVKNTKGSIKNGINFVNWNGDDKKYFHGFSESIANWSVQNIIDGGAGQQYRKLLINNNLSLDDYTYQSVLSSKNMVDLDKTGWALHFDARMLADYLEKIGKDRGITVVNGNFRNATTDEHGFIDTVYLDDSTSIECDFIFDCSGFNRLLIGKHFKQKWISYSDYLPMKCAIPFWLDSEEEIQPYTTATAMKYGWMWKIPLQHRIGSGYVFDSDYINEDQALQEAEEFYGRSLKVNKVIKFDAGRIENFWVKNCIAVGLSSNFIEPLESTSLYVTCEQLNFLSHFIDDFDSPRESSINTFNDVMKRTQNNILDFIYLHYVTKRQDSMFWLEFRQKNKMPPGFEKIFAMLKEANLRSCNLVSGYTAAGFDMMSFLQVGAGLKIFENDMRIQGFENVNPDPIKYKAIIDERIKNHARNHRILLESAYL
jgi:tryptophan halogenase